MNTKKFYISLPRKQFLLRMASLVLILSHAGFVPKMSAQDKDVTAPNDTVKQDNIINREQTDTYSALEKFLPPSPQAAALARYGEYPVSLATGVPEISIPLYEIKLGEYTLPISISYHASGIKVDDVASTVGLGWVLNAGGVVSRTICGAPDLRENRSETEDTLYRSYDRFHNIYSTTNYPEAYTNVFIPALTDGLNSTYDTASDRYSYNFGSKAGVFRYSHRDKKFVTLNHHPIDILYLDRGLETGYFEIYDSDGIVYSFRNKEKTIMPGSDYMCPTSWYLTNISTPYGNITFTYETAPSYETKVWSESLSVGKHHYYDYDLHSEDSICKGIHCSGPSYYHYGISILKKITWNGNTIDFSYSNDREDLPNRRLTSIVIRGCDRDTLKTVILDNNSYLGTTAKNKRMMLQSISISDEGTYTFTYNRLKNFPDYDISGHKDYWGYYNTDSTYLYNVSREAAYAAYIQFPETNYTATNDVSYANKKPNLSFAKTGILETITYPSGGHTHLIYELNLNGDAGGLRISSIEDSGPIGTTSRIRQFTYTGHATQNSPRDALVYDTYHVSGSIYPYFNYYNRKATCSSEPLIPLCDGSGSTVFYDHVQETDGLGNVTVYDYINGGILPTHFDYNNDPWPQLSPASLFDEGTCDPLLTSKKIYNGSSNLLRTEIYQYGVNRIDSFEIGVKALNILSGSTIDGEPIPASMLDYRAVPIPIRQMRGHVKKFLLEAKTITDYKQLPSYQPQVVFSTTENYTYDPLFRTLQPKTITKINSDGTSYRTVNEFPFECSSNVCDSMYNIRNMADIIVATRLYAGNTFLKMDSTLFLTLNNWHYPYKQLELRLNGSLFEKLQLSDYDTHGNPRTVIENGTDKTALVWGFKSSWPVAKVSGLSYTDLLGLGLTTTLNSIANDSVPSRMTNYLTTLRNSIGANGLVTTYNYKPLYGVSAITAENGYTTYYDYGTDGKLSAIRDNSGPLQQFAYQYAYPFSGSNDGTNYVQTMDMLSSTTGKITRQYYDGLGRPVETAKNITGNYVYAMQTYDLKGRVSQEWLPAVGGSSPNYLSSIQGLTGNPYPDLNAYSLTTYDALDRAIFIQTPGDTWHSASKGITKEYITNATNNVKRYSASLTGNSLIKNGYYTTTMLFGEKTTDEDNKTMTVFTDKMGRKILERQGTNNDTYYIYDDLDQLRFVLSPQYQEAGYKDVYGYEYRYDEKGRLVKKILPQCEYTQYWYDTAGRMKFMQDANLRSKGLYRFMLYDKYGRLCIQGTCTSCWRGETVNTTTYNTSGTGFQNTGYLLARNSDISGTITLEIVNYYDNYDFIRLYNSVMNTTNSTTTTGLQTGRISIASDGSMLTDAIYYDYKGRPIQTRSISLGSRLTTTTTSYKYWGDIYQTVQTDYPGTSTATTPTLTSTTTNNYNSTTGLLSNTTLSLKRGSATAVQKTIRQNTYDGLGRITNNTRNGNLAINYSYNLRNWLTEIEGTGFHEWLYYADFTGAGCSGTKYYNGNVSIQKWQGYADSYNRGYKFSYDGLNRLSEAVYGSANFSEHDNRYNEKVIEYSANSMIKRFQRRGLKSDGVYGKVDNLHIRLDGNRLESIVEDAGNQTVYGAMEFQSHSTSSVQYGYDGNGSLIWDANKQIAHITYDNLNFPKEVQFTNGNRIQYVYSPDGKKLRTTWQTAVGNIVVPLNTTQNLNNNQISSTTRTDYIGNVIYTGTASNYFSPVSLSKYLFEGGYATVTPSTQPVFHYYTQDHLGNNRAVVNQSGTVEQVTHYYPFGGFFADQGSGSSLQPYKYNGKELDRMHGLDLYDYGFRQYDPVVPMFTQVDPMAEKYYHLSPYVYCKNNPVNMYDSDGRKIYISNNRSQVLSWINSLTNGEFTINKNGFLVAPSTYSDVGSSYYTSMLSTAIKSNNTINIFVGNAIWANDEYKSLENYGEGATIPLNYKGDMKIVVSGNSYNGLKDDNGNKMIDTPNYILAHELVGHAIPMLIGGTINDNGILTRPINSNAIDNENKVRKETRVPLRDNKKVDKIYDENFLENINDYYDFMDMYNSIHWK